MTKHAIICMELSESTAFTQTHRLVLAFVLRLVYERIWSERVCSGFMFYETKPLDLLPWMKTLLTFDWNCSFELIAPLNEHIGLTVLLLQQSWVSSKQAFIFQQERKRSRPRWTRLTGWTGRWRSSRTQRWSWRTEDSGATSWSLSCLWPEKSSDWETCGASRISATRTVEVRRRRGCFCGGTMVYTAVLNNYHIHVLYTSENTLVHVQKHGITMYYHGTRSEKTWYMARSMLFTIVHVQKHGITKIPCTKCHVIPWYISIKHSITMVNIWNTWYHQRHHLQ